MSKLEVLNKYDLDVIETALKEVSGKDGVFLHYVKKGKSHPLLTTKNYQDLLKSERALEIIKEKQVDMKYLLYCFESGGFKKFNKKYGKLTQEEFEFLKEVLL